MQKATIYILLFLVTLLVAVTRPLYAQIKVQVVTREINNTIDWKPGWSLLLNAERAIINCTTHASNTIELNVQFIAKNEKRKAAETDLKKMKWLNERSGKKIYLRNYIELAKNESKPQSDIKVIYNIQIPEGCAVSINNYFGRIKIENLNSDLNIRSEFSDIDLQNIRGKTTITTNFGDITARKINGDVHIESARSDIDLSEIGGKLELNSKIAEIILAGIKKITAINIDAEKSKIHLIAGEYDRFSFNLELDKAEFTIPEKMNLEFTKNEKETVKAGFNNDGQHPQISIKLNTGTLTIER